MLVLNRKSGEKIVLTLPGGGTIEVTVGDVGRGRVKLLIDAPKDVTIARPR